MDKMKLVVNVEAYFEWLESPTTTEEKLMREQADNMAAAAAYRLNPAVQLLVLELLNSKLPNASLSRGEAVGLKR